MPSDLRRLYSLLLLLCPNTPPRQLLIDYFDDLAADCVGADQPDLAVESSPDPGSKFNDLLLRISSIFEHHGAAIAEKGLPTPRPPAHAQHRDEVHEQLQDFLMHKRDSLLNLLQTRIPLIEACDEQSSFFWDTVRRLRAKAHANAGLLHAVPGVFTPEADFDQRWKGSQLPPISDPEAAPSSASNAIFLSAKGGCGKNVCAKRCFAAARAVGMIALPARYAGLALQDCTGGCTLHS